MYSLPIKKGSPKNQLKLLVQTLCNGPYFVPRKYSKKMLNENVFHFVTIGNLKENQIHLRLVRTLYILKSLNFYLKEKIKEMILN